MTPPAKFALRLVLAGAALAWLIGDLGVWHGPLRRQLDRLCAPASVVVARVYDCPITRGQLDRAVSARLWLDGGQTGQPIAAVDRQRARAAALEELIDHELLRVKAQANAAQLAVSEAEITTRLQRLGSRFESPAELASALRSQGIANERDLHDLVAARLQQEKYLESKIGLLVRPTDAEARQWFDDHHASLAVPERVEVRQIFLPTLDHPSEEARAKLAAALAELTAGTRDFTTLAREISEDPATKVHGGALGWMTRARLPADFSAPVFALALHQPALIRSHLGWHLVEVTGRLPAQPRTYDQAQPEIFAALEAVKRQQVIPEFRNTLRHFEAAHIQIYHDLLGG